MKFTSREFDLKTDESLYRRWAKLSHSSIPLLLPVTGAVIFRDEKAVALGFLIKADDVGFFTDFLCELNFPKSLRDAAFNRLRNNLCGEGIKLGVRYFRNQKGFKSMDRDYLAMGTNNQNTNMWEVVWP